MASIVSDEKSAINLNIGESLLYESVLTFKILFVFIVDVLIMMSLSMSFCSKNFEV
jgi:hypothetical protein